MKKQLMYIVELEVAPGKEAALNELIRRLMEVTGKEQGVLHYHWGLNANRCLTIEHFEDKEAAINHLNAFATNFAKEYLALGEVTACTVLVNLMKK